MIKRFFGAMLLASAALLTGCLEDNDTDNTVTAVLPGMQIYDLAASQNGAVYQPANTAVRLAVLLAEAEKQQAASTDEETGDVALDELTYNNKKVQETLFGAGTTVEALEGGDYRITYPENTKLFGFYYEGALIVRTGGVQLAATDPTSGWSVDTKDFKVISETSAYVRRTILYGGGELRIFNTGTAFSVSAALMDLHFEGSEVHSDWTGYYNFMPDGTMSLAYSDCGGKPFSVKGTSEGDTFYSLAGKTIPTPMRYTLSDGSKYYLGGQLISGIVTAEFTAAGSYDPAIYPSPKVTYDYTYNPQSNTYSVEVEYNEVKLTI